jgi:hypothetical protein
LIEHNELETLYRLLLECYGKIEKINDKDRKLIRMIQLIYQKTLCDMGMKQKSGERGKNHSRID